MCTHLERLTSELEAAAHPALDALTNKVQAAHMLCISPECNSMNQIFACVAYIAVANVTHIACLRHMRLLSHMYDFVSMHRLGPVALSPAAKWASQILALQKHAT